MKKLFKLLTVVLSCVLLVSSLTGCLGKKDGDIDESKTQLYIYNYDGGYGTEWLYTLAERFEKDYANYELNGKTGVQVKIKPQKAIIKVSDNLQGMTQEIFFTESTNYYGLYNNNQMLDITDILNEKLTAYGEEGSILDKYYDEQKTYYDIGGKYYAVPHYFTPFGISYNKELFEEGYYIGSVLKDGTTPYNATTIEEQYKAGKTEVNDNDILFVKPNADGSNLSPGPDGNPATKYDNGLPATYSEFYLLCEKLSNSSAYAIHWAGAVYGQYFPMLLTCMATNNEGREQMNLNFDYSGTTTATNLIESFDGNGNPVIAAPTEITKTNGYELARQAGKYYAVDFLMTILNNTSWYKQDQNMLFSGSHLHTTAQKDFISAGKIDSKQIGMLIDGSWWESEATDTFKTLAEGSDPSLAKDQRRFGYLPFPHPTADSIGKSTLFDMYSSFGFIKSTIAEDKIPLAKAFLQYCNTNVSLQEYSNVTNTLKLLKYEITGDYYNGMTEYGKSLYELKNASDIVIPLSSDQYFINNQAMFMYDAMFAGKIGGATGVKGNITSPALLYPKSSGVATATAQEYYDWMKVYQKSNWPAA